MSYKIAIALILTAPMFSFASSVERSGTVQVGYDQQNERVLTKKIAVSFPEAGEDAILTIEGVELNPAVREKGVISAYAKIPKKHFYYQLTLDAPRNESGRIVRLREGSFTSSCSTASNALLTSYKGDGTKVIQCATVE